MRAERRLRDGTLLVSKMGSNMPGRIWPQQLSQLVRCYVLKQYDILELWTQRGLVRKELFAWESSVCNQAGVGEAVTHLPALRGLSQFDVVGVANSSAASSEAAVAATGIRRAFSSTSELITSPDVDVVVITVKVPHHLELVRAALAAGKHVYCEWPLGNGLAEAEEMARLAADTGLVAVAGMQARVAPEVMHLRDLVNAGVLGEVLSTTITGWGNGWGTLHRDREGAQLSP